MTITLDTSLHLVQVCAFIFWLGVTYKDVQWLKDEVKRMRDQLERIIEK